MKPVNDCLKGACVLSVNHRALERAKQLQAAARRRSDFERWRERYDEIARIKPRDADERQAKCEALMLMELARPGA